MVDEAVKLAKRDAFQVTSESAPISDIWLLVDTADGGASDTLFRSNWYDQLVGSFCDREYKFQNYLNTIAFFIFLMSLEYGAMFSKEFQKLSLYAQIRWEGTL